VVEDAPIGKRPAVAGASSTFHLPPPETVEGDGPDALSIFHLPPSTAEDGEADEEQGERVVVPPSAVSLKREAFHGLLGAIAKAAGPETDADEAAVLISLLVAFGNAVGPLPHALAGADRHEGNTFTLLVGPTSARKGQSESLIHWLMGQADPQWAKACVSYGLGTGEGLAERLQDERYEDDGKGVLVLKPGATEKRLMAIEREFATVLKKGGREGSTLSDMIRNAYDGKPLEVVNRKKNSLKATGHHVSIIGHITAEELAHELKGTEVANGFLNRFLLVTVTRSKKLPSGGNHAAVLEPFVKPLADALAKAAGHSPAKDRLLRRTPEAEALWADWYCSHAEYDGLLGKVTARAEAHALRLSLIYALADGASAIGVDHLRAALAVWEYCEKSAVALFGKRKAAGEGTTPPPLTLSEKLLQAIGIKPGILRTDLWDFVGHKVKADELAEALARLEAAGHAFRRGAVIGGREREAWYPAGWKVEGGRCSPPGETGDGPRCENDGGRWKVEDAPGQAPDHLPPSTVEDAPAVEDAQSIFHLPPSTAPAAFVEALADSRPAVAAREAGGRGVVVPPSAQPPDLIGDIHRSGGRLRKILPDAFLAIGVGPDHEAAIDLNPQAVADDLVTDAEFEAEMMAL